jgi:hypothetical protein
LKSSQATSKDGFEFAKKYINLFRASLESYFERKYYNNTVRLPEGKNNNNFKGN